MMVKAPVAGGVKTRLAHEIGAAEAIRFYRAQMNTAIRRLSRDSRWRFVLSIAPDIAAHAPVWGRVRRMRQGKGNLGDRMQRAFDAQPPGPVAIIGSDIPAIRAHHIEKAFKCLGEADAVIGPANDGGYWLIGLKRRPHLPRPFADVRWSTSHAFADTLVGLKGYSIAECDILDDIDIADDYLNWRRGGV